MVRYSGIVHPEREGEALPPDVEPYGPGDSEYAAGQRLLRRTVQKLGSRFADHGATRCTWGL